MSRGGRYNGTESALLTLVLMLTLIRQPLHCITLKFGTYTNADTDNTGADGSEWAENVALNDTDSDTCEW